MATWQRKEKMKSMNLDNIKKIGRLAGGGALFAIVVILVAKGIMWSAEEVARWRG